MLYAAGCRSILRRGCEAAESGWIYLTVKRYVVTDSTTSPARRIGFEKPSWLMEFG